MFLLHLNNAIEKSHLISRKVEENSFSCPVASTDLKIEDFVLEMSYGGFYLI